MNKINVEPKSITISAERTITVPERTLNVESVQWTTIDDSFAKRLVIRVNGQLGFNIEGAEYDALGQWTDEDIAGLIIGKYGFKQI
jgi:hypothetical protein